MNQQNQQAPATILTELLTITVELWYALDEISAADLLPAGYSDGELLRKAEAIIAQVHAVLNQSSASSTPCCPSGGSPLEQIGDIGIADCEHRWQVQATRHSCPQGHVIFVADAEPIDAAEAMAQREAAVESQAEQHAE